MPRWAGLSVCHWADDHHHVPGDRPAGQVIVLATQGKHNGCTPNLRRLHNARLFARTRIYGLAMCRVQICRFGVLSRPASSLRMRLRCGQDGLGIGTPPYRRSRSIRCGAVCPVKRPHAPRMPPHWEARFQPAVTLWRVPQRGNRRRHARTRAASQVSASGALSSTVMWPASGTIRDSAAGQRAASRSPCPHGTILSFAPCLIRTGTRMASGPNPHGRAPARASSRNPSLPCCMAWPGQPRLPAMTNCRRGQPGRPR
jgi:hypothetical protein